MGVIGFSMISGILAVTVPDSVVMRTHGGTAKASDSK